VRLQGLEKWSGAESTISPHHELFKTVQAELGETFFQELNCAVGCVNISRPELRLEAVTGLTDEGEQRVKALSSPFVGVVALRSLLDLGPVDCSHVRVEVYVENLVISPTFSILTQEERRNLRKLSDALLAEPAENSTQGALYGELLPAKSPEQGEIPPKPGHLAYAVETGHHPKQKGCHDPSHRVDSWRVTEIQRLKGRLGPQPAQELCERNQPPEAGEVLGREVEEKPPDLVAKTMAEVYAQGVPPVQV
jgi:hypothetical protein